MPLGFFSFIANSFCRAVHFSKEYLIMTGNGGVLKVGTISPSSFSILQPPKTIAASTTASNFSRHKQSLNVRSFWSQLFLIFINNREVTVILCGMLLISLKPATVPSKHDPYVRIKRSFTNQSYTSSLIMFSKTNALSSLDVRVQQHFRLLYNIIIAIFVIFI